MTGQDRQLRAALVDLDGTVLHGGQVIPGAIEGIEALRSAGLRVCFLTNNPTRTAAAWAESLTERDIDATPEDVVTSMDATLQYLRQRHHGETVLPIAAEAIVEQLREAGFTVTDDPERADLVLAGFDQAFDYEAMQTGLRAILAGTPLVGTDPDRWVPTDEGPIPGSGAVVNAVAGAAETEPEAVLGKPSQVTVDVALERLGVSPTECLLVGDRLDTDVRMGETAGMETVLVLTGASDGDDVETAGVTPDHVLDSLGEVGSVLDS